MLWSFGVSFFEIQKYFFYFLSGNLNDCFELFRIQVEKLTVMVEDTTKWLCRHRSYNAYGGSLNPVTHAKNWPTLSNIRRHKLAETMHLKEALSGLQACGLFIEMQNGEWKENRFDFNHNFLDPHKIVLFISFHFIHKWLCKFHFVCFHHLLNDFGWHRE